MERNFENYIREKRAAIRSRRERDRAVLTSADLARARAKDEQKRLLDLRESAIEEAAGQVRATAVEAAEAFVGSDLQTDVKVRYPMPTPSTEKRRWYQARTSTLKTEGWVIHEDVTPPEQHPRDWPISTWGSYERDQALINSTFNDDKYTKYTYNFCYVLTKEGHLVSCSQRGGAGVLLASERIVSFVCHATAKHIDPRAVNESWRQRLLEVANKALDKE